VTKRSSAGSRDKKKRKEKLYKRQDGQCAYCGISLEYGEMTLDHIIPLSKGGTNALSNLRGACMYCNRDKAANKDYHLNEWKRNE
jgi:5-methylcytosine-specific restriction endonuclease McrA